MKEMMTVGELNRSARQCLEQAFPLLWVTGEISNFTRAASGHWYFSLKDEAASVRCVMFRQKNLMLDFLPKEGMQVEARVLVTLYEARGDFQLGVEVLRKSGTGSAFEAFLRLKEKLEKEGLFAAERKRAICSHPQRIGIVTSLKAAALHDILRTLKRRMPSIAVVLYPASVQGEGAAESLATAIRTAGMHGICDTLILARGGGSIEDLSAFNDERLARAIASCPIPVVCGVGHETDFTISDFAADLRAPTPTAAAEVASPDREDLFVRIFSIQKRLRRMTLHSIESWMQHVDHLGKRIVHPRERLVSRMVHLRHLSLRLDSAVHRKLEKSVWKLVHLEEKLPSLRLRPEVKMAEVDALRGRMLHALKSGLAEKSANFARLSASLGNLDPDAVLCRGYSIVEDDRGEIVSDASILEPGERVRIRFGKGEAQARVLSGDQCS